MKLHALALILVLIATQVFAQSSGTNTAQFLKLAPNARAAGMGNAFTGLADDVHAMFWNPGGLGFLNRYELGISGQSLFGELLHFSLMGVHTRPFLGSQRAAFGLGLIYLGATDDFQSTENLEAPVSAGEVSNLAILVPFGYRLDPISENLSVGATYKLVRSKLDEFSASGHGVDVGALYRLSLFNDYELSLGGALQNYTLLPMKFVAVNEDLPLTMRGGLALKVPIGERHEINLGYDASKPDDNQLLHHLGAEYWWRFSALQKLAVRAGYRLNADDLGDFSLSLGYGINLTQFDYAFNNYQPGFLGSANLGTLYLRSSSLEGFDRLFPRMDAELREQKIVELVWEEARDYSSRETQYLVVLDVDPSKVTPLLTSGRSRKVFRDAEKDARLWDPTVLREELKVRHAQLLRNGMRSSFVDTSAVTQQFHWAVIARNDLYHVRNAGPEPVGSFINHKDPDILPLALRLEPYDRLDVTDNQGTLHGKVELKGLNAAAFKVRVVDRTENTKVVGEVEIKPDPKDRAQEHSFKLPWNTSLAGAHALRLIADPDNQQGEMDESNNSKDFAIPTIPKGFVQAPDTTVTEFRAYESVELPTLVYVFFEPNSAELSQASTSKNDELHPDSLLALLGQRLRNNYPRLNITVRGFYNPASETATKDGATLARKREKVITEKLVQYGSHPEQISRYLERYDEAEPIAITRSPNVDPQEVAMVAEENRRVEIRVSKKYTEEDLLENEKRLFSPRRVILDPQERISHHVAFQPHIDSGRPLASIRIELRATPSDPFPLYATQQEPDRLKSDTLFVWDCRRGEGERPLVAFNRDYSFHVIVTDSAGCTYTSEAARFHLVKRTDVIERRIFSLARFDKPTPLHEFYLRYLKDVENTLLDDGRIGVRLIGHTDAIGLEGYNDWLSARRAGELARNLRDLISNDVRIGSARIAELHNRIEPRMPLDKSDPSTWSQFGAGEKSPLVIGGYLYGDNSRPQGRHVNRRVEIELIDRTAFDQPEAMPLVQELTFPAEIFGRRFSNEITAMASSDSVIWIGTGQALVRWLPARNEFRTLLPPGRSYLGVTSLLTDASKRTIWVGTRFGLYSLKADSIWTSYETGSLGLTGSSINDLAYDDDGKLLLATNEGILRYDGSRFATTANLSSGLNDNFVNRLYRDREGRLWACTKQGISFAEGTTWQRFHPEGFGNDGLAFDDVRSMAVDSAGNYWLATPAGVLVLAKEHWRHFDLSDGLPGLNVTDLLLDNAGAIWCATERGIARLEHAAGIPTQSESDRPARWQAFTSTHGLVGSRVHRLIYHADRLFACTSGGLSVLLISRPLFGAR